MLKSRAWKTFFLVVLKKYLSVLGIWCLCSGEAPLTLFLRSNEDIKPYMDSIIILFIVLSFYEGFVAHREQEGATN